MSPNKQKNQLTKNIFSLAVVQIATYVLPLISVPIISRIIGPGKYGVINFAAAFIVYFNLIVSYSFDFTATRKVSREPENEQIRSQVFSEVFFTQCLLFAFASIVFIVLLFTVPELQQNKTIFIFSFLVCVASLFTQNWLFQAMQDLPKVALFNLVSKLLFTAAIIIAVRKPEDYIWQPFLIGVIQVIIAVWSFVWSIKRYKIKLVAISVRKCLGVLWEDRIIFCSLVFVNLYSYTTIVILGLYQSSEQVGYYTSAQRLIAIAQSVLTMPLAQSFYPFVGKAFGESKEKGIVVVQRLVPLIMIFVGSASLAMIVLGPIVLTLFYGQTFQAAVPVFQMLAITPLLFSLNNVLGVQIMLNLKMDKSFFTISAAAALVSVTLNLLMIPHWGFWASTINSVIIEVFLFISMFLVLRRKGLHPFDLKYFRWSSLSGHLQPLKAKFLPRTA